MGLLTNPTSGRGKLPLLLIKYNALLCILLYVSGVVWFGLLAHKQYNAATYFSENALLPGLVDADFDEQDAARRYLETLTSEAERYQKGVPVPWLVSAFGQLGLDVYVHNFTLRYPLGEGHEYTGSNIYAILRAPRSANTEAVVFSAPYRPPRSVEDTTAPSVALMLALAKFFRRQIYWAKDIVFVVTEHEQLGMQAWLEAYHRRPCGSGILDSGDLEERSGAIQAAINLELHSPRPTHLDVKVEGLNGQLPNLDLVNLIHRLCMRERVWHTFKGRDDPANAESFDGWLHSFRTVMRMVATHATGVPNGNHGLFHRFGIEAVTLEGVRDGARGRAAANFLQLGRVLEGIFRSLNNLLEKFHQSFFFYLLPATNRYVSIGMYMPPFGLIAAPLLVKAVALWFQSSEDEEESQRKPGGNAKNINYSVLQFAPTIMLYHIIGTLVKCSPVFFSKLGTYYGLSTDDAVYYGIFIACLLCVFMPCILRRKLGIYNGSWKVLKCLSLLELATLLFSVAVYNISLALVVTITYVPVVAFISPPTKRWLQPIKHGMMLLIHPLTLAYLVVGITTSTAFPEEDVLATFWRAVDANKSALVFAVVDGYIYGNWMFDVVCQILLSNWLMFWTVSVSCTA